MPGGLRQERALLRGGRRHQRRQERCVPVLHVLVHPADQRRSRRVRRRGEPRGRRHPREQNLPQRTQAGHRGPGGHASRDARVAQAGGTRHRGHREPDRTRVRVHHRPEDRGVHLQNKRGELPRQAPTRHLQARPQRPRRHRFAGRIQPAAQESVPKAVHKQQLPQDVQHRGGERRGTPDRVVRYGVREGGAGEGHRGGRGSPLAAPPPRHHLANLVRLHVQLAGQVANGDHRRRQVHGEPDAGGVPQERGDHGPGVHHPSALAQARG
mmetsp:Transcript_2185/g.5547  ORF Transcript_2185/g.5547 Transcript_2185/m.5547 type:complete len:268 (-) Transcript_2185:1030-1833(-)